MTRNEWYVAKYTGKIYTLKEESMIKEEEMKKAKIMSWTIESCVEGIICPLCHKGIAHLTETKHCSKCNGDLSDVVLDRLLSPYKGIKRDW